MTRRFDKPDYNIELLEKVESIILDISTLENEVEKLKHENKTLKNYINKSILFTATLMNWPEDRVKRLWADFYKNYDKEEREKR